MYIVIHTTLDSQYVSCLSKDEVEKRLNDTEAWYGNKIVFLDSFPEKDICNLSRIPADTLIIIKGDIILPKPVEKVIEYVLD